MAVQETGSITNPGWDSHQKSDTVKWFWYLLAFTIHDLAPLRVFESGLKQSLIELCQYILGISQEKQYSENY